MKTLKYLYILACFVTGAAMMIIEVSGIRLLAPVFGNSLYTWTALIGVVLVGFSLGGFLGGYLADKTTSPGVIVGTLVVSAVFIIMVPSLHVLTVEMTRDMSMLYGPSVLSVILFLIPGSLLGVINPYATRLLAKLTDDKKIGAATGAANVASALGSFLGTFVAGFYLVPHLDVRVIFMLTAAALVLLAIAIQIKAGLKLSSVRMAGYSSMLVFAFVFSSGLKLSYGPSAIQVTNSKYQQIIVFESIENGAPIRKMINNGQTQGGINLNTAEMTSPYQNYWKIMSLYRNRIDSVLIVGGGTYGVPQSILDAHPDADITVIEIDEDVTETAMEYFNLDQYPSITVVNSDARWFSNNDNKQYDYIYLDAYNGNSALPSHLTTVEYFNTMKDRLAPGGFVMLNAHGNEHGPTSGVFGALYNTFGSVFGEVDVYKMPFIKESSNMTNLILLASVDGHIPDPKYQASDEVAGYLDRLVPKNSIRVSRSPVLTDNLNPLEVIASKLQFSVNR